jgi:hypothetical protein
VSNIQKTEAEFLIAEFRQIYAQVKDLGKTEILENSSPELYAVFKRMDKLAALDVDKEFIDFIFKSLDFGSLIASISRFRF